MKLERTKNSIKGIKSGVINKIIVLLVPFFVRTIFINTLGIEYLGLNTLFSSILNILNLTELGVGYAISFNMFDAIAKEDKNKICALMNFYKNTYRIIGCIVIVLGLIILPFINFICKSDIPNDINIYLLYILHLINTSLTYFLYAYKTCLINAHQQNHISNNINTVIHVLLDVVQAFFLLIGKNYYWYIIPIIFATIINNIVSAIITSKIYPDYIPDGELSGEEKNKIYNNVKGIFFYKIGSVVLTSVDSIVISSFLGLNILGKYNNYYAIITMLFGFIQIYINSMFAGVGNSVIEETVEKNYNDFKKLNFMQSWIVGWCSICLICLYQTFIKLWIGNEYLFPLGVPIMLAVYFYVWKMMDVINLYKEAAGMWSYDKYRPLIASIVNLIINMILVNKFGIYGIIFSTILSIVIVILPWSSYVLFKYYFKKGYKAFWLDYIKNTLLTIIAGITTFYITYKVEIKTNILELLIKGLICIIIPNMIFLIFNIKNTDFKETKNWILERIKCKNEE